MPVEKKPLRIMRYIKVTIITIMKNNKGTSYTLKNREFVPDQI
ncbi:hypothetical protein HMPREF3220_02939 [Citrobacter koseri]|nr:hypothetical protein HMPREF3220_02939 [Citrobacter koseri]